jgi:hypothetical protein
MPLWVGAGGATGVEVVRVDDVTRVDDVIREDVGVGNTFVEFTPMQTARCCFSARSLYKLLSQLDPTHGFQSVRLDMAIPASEAILAQLRPVECVSGANSIEIGISYSL